VKHVVPLYFQCTLLGTQLTFSDLRHIPARKLKGLKERTVQVNCQCFVSVIHM